MLNAIETTMLRKTFGDTCALDDVSLCVAQGSVFGLLGPNGAGKTTTIRVLATLLKPSSGSARVLGLDVVKDAALVRQKVSLTGQYASIDDDLTGHENLVLLSRLLGMSWANARSRATELLEAFGLADAAKRQVQNYSGGMRRRIDIAASLVARPEILFLDEPTTGLDPRSRNQVWELVRQVAAEGTTVLLTTQYLEEADRLAERMAVIDQGRVIAEGTSRELKASIGGNSLRIELADIDQHAAAKGVVAGLVGDARVPTTEPGTISVKVSGASLATDVLQALGRAEIQLTSFSLGEPSLDEVFFALTGRPPEAPRSARGEEAAS